jgi:hypothetical protein
VSMTLSVRRLFTMAGRTWVLLIWKQENTRTRFAIFGPRKCAYLKSLGRPVSSDELIQMGWAGDGMP